MRKLVYLFILFLSMSTSYAQQNAKYLAGAVPEKGGKVYFSKSIKMNQLTKNDIFQVVADWSKAKFIPEKELNRRTFVLDTVNSKIVAQGDEYLVFQNTLLSLDRSRILYLFSANCADGVCYISFTRILYFYNVATSDVPEKYSAEELITDANALRKGKLIRTSDKFRIKTIDLVDGIVDEITDLLGKKALSMMNESKN